MVRKSLVLFFIPFLTLALFAGCGSSTSDEESSFEGAVFAAPAAPTLLTELYPAWLGDERYAPGDIVTYDGKYFRAAEGNHGQAPQTEDCTAWIYLGDVPTDLGKYFLDVKDNTWYAEAINTLAAEGILTGTGSHNYLPSRPITRAQFAALLCRTLEIQPVMSGDNFDDAGNTWYTPYLAALKQKGISIDEEDSSLFLPDQPITRQEACTLIYDACDGFSEDPVTVFAPYTDSGDVASWAIRSLSWCVERNIVQGYGNRLQPEEILSRAEAAQIFYNLLYPSVAAHAASE